RDLRLLAGVVAVPRRLVPVSGRQQPQPVVQPQRLEAQARLLGERADRHGVPLGGGVRRHGQRLRPAPGGRSSAMIDAMYLAVVIALVLLNGLFAMSEIAVVSANRFRLQQRAEQGDRGAARALGLAENPDRFLSTVQVGITLVAVVSGAIGGATLTGPVADAGARRAGMAPS